MELEHHSSVVTKWIFILVKAEIILLLTTWPMLYLLLNLSMASNVNEVGTLVLTIIALVPFIVAPGWCAAYATVRHFYRKEEEPHFWRTIWYQYKENYKAAMLTGLVFDAWLFVLYTAFWYYGRFGAMGRAIPLVVMVLSVYFFLFVLAYVADREESLLGYWHKSLQIIMQHPVLFLSLLFETTLTGLIGFVIKPLMILVAPGVICLIVMYFYLQMTKLEEAKAGGRARK
ncbi:DUF624 domain-containing protein [Schleiferilactobacillus harbinensis]|uniref:DUF624 domain-containing protein n=1 Tax=Schleiferilactobacillus harbinensis TaxID=304207 RepID=UPI00345E8D0F